MVRKIVVVVGILALVVLGFWFISNMTGGVISGVGDEVVVEEYFKIDGVAEINETEDLNDTQNSSGSG